MPIRALKILHTADFHLGSPYRFLPMAKQKQIQAEAERSFYGMVDLASREKVDFITVAGDLFDSVRPDVALFDRVKQALSSLGNLPVIINPGNHDYWHEDGFWQELDSLDNVYILQPDKICQPFPDYDLAFWGKAFTSQSSDRPLWQIKDEAHFNEHKAEYNILLEHGDILNRQSNYNPISLSWIDQMGFQLALLGHIHNPEGPAYSRQGVLCLYNGCCPGRGFDELGEKGVHLLEIADLRQAKQAKINFVPLDGPRFYRLNFNMSALDSDFSTQIYEEISRKVLADFGHVPAKFDSCQLLCQGSYGQNLNFDLLYQKLQEHFFYLEIKDETRLRIDQQVLLSEHSLRGDVSRYAKQLATRPDLLNRVLEEVGLSDLDIKTAKEVIDQAYYFTMQAADRDLDIYED